MQRQSGTHSIASTYPFLSEAGEIFLLLLSGSSSIDAFGLASLDPLLARHSLARLLAMACCPVDWRSLESSGNS